MSTDDRNDELTNDPAPAPEVPFRVEPDTPVRDDASPADESRPTTQLPPPAYPPAVPAPAPTPPPLVTVNKGPRPGTILLGLLAMVVAAWVFVENLTDATLDLSTIGPSAIGALGVLLLVVGLAGVVLGRRR